MLINTVSAQYCPSKSNAPWELWIKNVRLNTINFESGKFKEYNSLGYSDYSNITTKFLRGRTYELTIVPGVSWSGVLANTYCRVWIDWNQNRIFEDYELVYQNTGTATFVGSFRSSETANFGTTRMRIALKSGSYATPCELFGSGEVEDYSLKIFDPIPQENVDLAVSNLSFPTNIETNQAVPFSYDVKNIGTNRTNYFHLAKTYLSTDTILSGDDLLVHSTKSITLSNLSANQQTTVRDTFLLSPIWTSNTGYFIVKIDPEYPEYIDFDDANNTRISPVINVSIPQLGCVNSLGSGKVLCFDNSNFNSINIYVVEGDLIKQKTVNKSGVLLNSMTIGSSLKDSILVVNNQVIKKLANGTIAYSKTITPSVLSRFQTISVAAEFTDGTFVLGGFQKIRGTTGGIDFAQDSLVLINTDANLSFQESIVLFKKSEMGFIRAVPNDRIYALIAQENNGVLAIFSNTQPGGNYESDLHFLKFQKTGNTLVDRGSKTFGSEFLSSKLFQTNVCGNSILFSTYFSFVGARSDARGDFTRQLNLESLVVTNNRGLGNGFSSYGGSYLTNDYYQQDFLANSLGISSYYSGNPFTYYNSFQYIDVYFKTGNNNTFRKTLPTINYDHIIRTGDTTCLFVTNVGGNIKLFNPNCNSLSSNQPDLTLENLTIPTPSVQQGQILNFNVDGKNIGTAAATGNFTIKSYLSTDQILDASDYKDGSIPTANYTVGTNILQIAGAMTVTNAVALGSYYLILKIDADNQITESNELNNVIVSTNVIAVTAPSNSANDIALSLSSTPSVYRQYSTQNFTITAKNTNNQAFSDVKIDFPYPTKTVNGGNATPSIGTWQEWCAGGTQCFTWTIPTLAANTTATLDIPVYVLDAVGTMTATTRLLSSNPVDNNPSNNVATVSISRSTTPFAPPLNPSLGKSEAVFLQQVRPTITENYIIVELESLVEKTIDFQILNTLGNVVLTEKIKMGKGNNKFDFDVSQLPKGMYFIQTSVGKGRNVPMKFVKY